MDLTLSPGAASDRAASVDALFIGLSILSLAIVVLVVGLIATFAIRYRAGSKAPRGSLPDLFAREVELGWTAATLFVALFFFWWASTLDARSLWPPADALEVHIEARQWMWKAKHPSGAREINALHVPINVPVKLYMASQDVIHSFYVPAFRVKKDVVPGRVSTLWFTALKTGTYHLLCTEFCGTGHSAMIGTVTAMAQEDYAAWSGRQPVSPGLVDEGAALFVAAGCSGCHAGGSAVHAPSLAGVYGRAVHLDDGRTVTADDAYLTDSILMPKRDVVAGYRAIMPSFAGLLAPGEVAALVAYVTTIGRPEPAVAPPELVSPAMRAMLPSEAATGGRE